MNFLIIRGRGARTSSLSVPVQMPAQLLDCKPRPRLEAEILILRHQLNVLQQRSAVGCICVGSTAPCSSGSIVATPAFWMQ